MLFRSLAVAAPEVEAAHKFFTGELSKEMRPILVALKTSEEQADGEEEVEGVQRLTLARVDKASWILRKKDKFPMLGADNEPIPGRFVEYPKNTAMIVVKLLSCADNEGRKYVVPIKAKKITIMTDALVMPGSHIGVDRFSYLGCTMHREKVNGKEKIHYMISEAGRESLSL